MSAAPLAAVGRYLDLPASLRPPVWREFVVRPTARRTRIANAATPRHVVLVPGFGATDHSTRSLANVLATAGHTVHGASTGTTFGCTDVLVDRLIERIDGIDRESPVALVGHSRGGQLAKLAAQRRPDLIDDVVTLGSPLTDPWGMHLSLKLSIAAMVTAMRAVRAEGRCGETGCPFGACEERITAELMAAPPAGVALTSIFSRRDGITQLPATQHPDARLVEVECSHLAMATGTHAHRAVLTALDR